MSMETSFSASFHVSSARYFPVLSTVTNQRLGAPMEWSTPPPLNRNLTRRVLANQMPSISPTLRRHQNPSGIDSVWRDVICPFEYKFGDGDYIHVCLRKSTISREHVLMVCRTVPRHWHCGASTISCTATPVERSPLGSQYMERVHHLVIVSCCSFRLRSFRLVRGQCDVHVA